MAAASNGLYPPNLQRHKEEVIVSRLQWASSPLKQRMEAATSLRQSGIGQICGNLSKQPSAKSCRRRVVDKCRRDVVRSGAYLHSQGVIHRDLKSDNLLLNDEMRVKVVDFGTSCLETKSRKSKGNMGTYRWMAPEMIKEKPYTRKVDVYSFGIVLWELTTTLVPFQGMTPVQAAYDAAEKVGISEQYNYLSLFEGHARAHTHTQSYDIVDMGIHDTSRPMGTN
ncbi:hypothetical protein J5N97_002912 [Dioscorea zingiberensis]|uniref:Protein kinase domain-containing protein n=1 Tax=Dioscorea zingiberensis TaxID=325984 RepID=A0A9D5HQ27_9LILI|nr:hypothetical protein J5N97_002912 [Dioscorea zingiberensis]